MVTSTLGVTSVEWSIHAQVVSVSQGVPPVRGHGPRAGVRAVTRAQGHTTMMDRTYGLSEDASEARAESVGNLLVAAGIGG